MKNELVVNARELQRLVNDRINMLNRLGEQCDRECIGLPGGRLHAAKRGKYVAYYHITKKGDKTGIYIPKANIKDAEKLAQREYNEYILSEIKKEKFHLQHLLDTEERMKAVIIPEVKLKLVNKVTTSDEEFIDAFMREERDTCRNEEITTDYYTAKGEHVRSKSECLIADTLNRLNIPYKYECQCNCNKRENQLI